MAQERWQTDSFYPCVLIRDNRDTLCDEFIGPHKQLLIMSYWRERSWKKSRCEFEARLQRWMVSTWPKKQQGSFRIGIHNNFEARVSSCVGEVVRRFVILEQDVKASPHRSITMSKSYISLYRLIYDLDIVMLLWGEALTSCSRITNLLTTSPTQLLTLASKLLCMPILKLPCCFFGQVLTIHLWSRASNSHLLFFQLLSLQ